MRAAMIPSAIVLAVGLPSLGCYSEPAGPADQLIDAWIDAAGGPNAWRDVNDLGYTVTTVWFDSTGTETRRRPRFVWGKKHPQRARIERDEAEGHYVQAHDGHGTAWATLNDVQLADTFKAVEEVLYVSGDVMYWIGLPYKLRDPGVNLRHIPPDSTGYPGVAVTFGDGVGEHSGDRYFYYFGEESRFPIEVHYVEEGRTNVNRMKWSDYQQAGTITFVGTRTYYDETGTTRKQLIISDVRINPGIVDSMFAPPGT